MGSLFTCPLVLDLSHLFRDPPYLLERVPGEGSKGPQVLVLSQSCVVVDLVTGFRAISPLCGSVSPEGYFSLTPKSFSILNTDTSDSESQSQNFSQGHQLERESLKAKGVEDRRVARQQWGSQPPFLQRRQISSTIDEPLSLLPPGLDQPAQLLGDYCLGTLTPPAT